MVQVLEGTGRFTVDGDPHILHEGESIVMPAGIPHAVFGEERFKMLLTVIFKSYWAIFPRQMPALVSATFL